MQTVQTAVREALVILAAAVLLALVYSGITQKGLFGRPEPPSFSSESEAPTTPETISIDEAEELFASGKAVFIDTRDELSYREGHIRGAIHVSLLDLPLRIESLKALAAEKTLVPYCNGTRCHSSMEFGGRLFAAGIPNVKVFFGGWEEWTASQLPTERSAP
ncbi:MAG: rhodanese-like domain-containing protein [Thermodesulfobacteriota bacterium]